MKDSGDVYNLGFRADHKTVNMRIDVPAQTAYKQIRLKSSLIGVCTVYHLDSKFETSQESTV